MICPLLTINHVYHPDGTTPCKLVECVKDKCAWWEDNRCVIQTLVAVIKYGNEE